MMPPRQGRNLQALLNGWEVGSREVSYNFRLLRC